MTKWNPSSLNKPVAIVLCLIALSGWVAADEIRFAATQIEQMLESTDLLKSDKAVLAGELVSASLLLDPVNDRERSLQQQMLALALGLEPDNRPATITVGRLRIGKFAPQLGGLTDQVATKLAHKLLQAARKSNPSQNGEMAILLIDLSIRLAPKNDDILFESEVLREELPKATSSAATQVKSGWNRFFEGVGGVLAKKPSVGIRDRLQKIEDPPAETSDPVYQIAQRASLRTVRLNWTNGEVKGSLVRVDIQTWQRTGMSSQRSTSRMSRAVDESNQVSTATDREKLNFVQSRSASILLDECMVAAGLLRPRIKTGHFFEVTVVPGDNGMLPFASPAAVALGLVALADKVKLDQDAMVLGDISVDGKIGLTDGKIEETEEGIAIGFCLSKYIAQLPKLGIPIAAVPFEKPDVLDDLELSDGMKAAVATHLFSAKDIDSALALAREDRSPELTRALRLWKEVAGLIRDKERPASLKRHLPKLEEILTLAPNSLSAQFLKRVAEKGLANKYSFRGSINEIRLLSTKFSDQISQKLTDQEGPIENLSKSEIESAIGSVASRIKFEASKLSRRIDERAMPVMLALQEMIRTGEILGKSVNGSRALRFRAETDHTNAKTKFGAAVSNAETELK